MRSGRFKNPPNSPKQNHNIFLWIPFLVRRLLSLPNADIPQGHIIQRNILQLKDFDSLTWIGHNTFLIRLNGYTILTDPFFSQYASPIKGLGPKRVVPPPVRISELPKIDIIVISHDHYDHLDLETLRKIPNKENIQTIVPSKLGYYLQQCGYNKIQELDWYEEFVFDSIHITALPAVHFSKRTIFTTNKTLWASFSIISDKRKILFMCDSAYSTIFSEIGRKYGPFDYALIGIGAYLIRHLMRAVHTSPEEAIKLGIDVRARNIVAMHWGTIPMADDSPFEAPKYFLDAGLEAGFSQNELWIMRIGETRRLYTHYTSR